MQQRSQTRGPVTARGNRWLQFGSLLLLCIMLAWSGMARANDCPNFNVPDANTAPSTTPMASGTAIVINVNACDPLGLGVFPNPVTSPSHGTVSIDNITDYITYTNNGDGATSDYFTFQDLDANVISVTIAIGAATSPITVLPASLPAPQVGTAYSQTLSASGGTAPYTFAKVSGALPPGMTFSGDTFSGTPTEYGNFTVGIQVTDANSVTTTKSYTLAIPAPTLTLSNLSAPSVGVPYNQTISGTGGTPPLPRFHRPGSRELAGRIEPEYQWRIVRHAHHGEHVHFHHPGV